MEISIEKLDTRDMKYGYDAFTVLIEDKRILSLYTEDHSTVKKWITEVLKSQKSRSTPLIVGLSVDRKNRYPFGKESENANPFSIIHLCVGSHCLIYDLPFTWAGYGYRSRHKVEDPSLQVPKSLQDFLSDPQTICVGLNIESVANKLEKIYGFKIEKRVEVRSLVEKGLGHGVSGDLDKLVKIDLKMNAVRPKVVDWYKKTPGVSYWWSNYFSHEKAKFATVDAYLCYLIGSKYCDDDWVRSSWVRSDGWERTRVFVSLHTLIKPLLTVQADCANT